MGRRSLNPTLAAPPIVKSPSVVKQPPLVKQPSVVKQVPRAKELDPARPQPPPVASTVADSANLAPKDGVSDAPRSAADGAGSAVVGTETSSTRDTMEEGEAIAMATYRRDKEIDPPLGTHSDLWAEIAWRINWLVDFVGVEAQPA